LPNLRPPRPLQRQRPSRRPHRRFIPKRRQQIGWRWRAALATGLVCCAVLAWAILARQLAPSSNTSHTRFDVIIVLGYPADSDGNPTPRQLARVTEGVREYGRGVAPRLILTGGAGHNRFVEADVMARAAEAQGIPRSAILLEPRALDTIQNACYAERIMKSHGWQSAEVVSSASHLPRASLIFRKLPLEWRMHAAPPLEPGSSTMPFAESAYETLKTIRYLTYASWAERCEQ
jgi:uncharacterized SAM-binding protein YcdF (DUF218 family)